MSTKQLILIGLATLLTVFVLQTWADTIDPDYKPFDAEDAALDKAVIEAYTRQVYLDPDIEYGGIVYVNARDKKTVRTMRVSDLHTDRSDDSLLIRPKDWMPDFDNQVLLAWYHSHPCHPVTHWVHVFSMNDMSSSYYYGVPGYMLDMCDGAVHKFDPVAEYEVGPDRPFARGKIIGYIHFNNPAKRL